MVFNHFNVLFYVYAVAYSSLFQLRILNKNISFVLLSLDSAFLKVLK